MAFEVKLTVSDSGGVVPRNFTVLTEDKSFINSVINVGEKNTIKFSDINKLQRAMSVAGDFNVLEECDLSGRNLLKSQIKSKDAEYQESGVWSAIINVDFNHINNDYICVKVPTGTKMSSVKQKYKLPDGALTNYLNTEYGKAPGDRDTFSVTNGEVWFKASDFAKGNGMTVDEVKAMFSVK